MSHWFDLVVDVPDHPKPGIVFKDITPLIANGPAFREVIEHFAAAVLPMRPTHLVGVESRGFIFGAALAHALGLGLTLARKPGKLPRQTRKVSYALEYGSDALELHADATGPGDRVVVIDDVLATGGTASAVSQLVRDSGAELAGLVFLMELGFLDGRARLPAVPVVALKVL